MQENSTLILPIGTQIVALIEVKVLNENRFQSRGTVGVIKSSPKDATHSYLVEFPDGSLGSIKRSEFAIRKQYQTETAIDPLEDQNLYNYVIYRCVVGSRAFGLDDEKSDTDLRGIYLPPANLHWSMYSVPEQLENKDNEECYWELQKFLLLALKANPNVLECLNTPLIEFKNPIADELLAIKNVFLSKLVYQTYNGYVMSQFKKLEQDLRSTGEIRWKHAMHLIRLLLQGIEILKTGELTVKMEANRDKLLMIKRGELLWESINDWRLMLHKDFENAFAQTKLPERPDYERANQFLITARRKMI
ncbi:MAG TPA: nucleotidyltransferase domain-containing protein [Pyrinomonadaceae bacterium]|nr:nucleotidyltransferase domain-containing protein [Pyrinomonadaceae bacterium]